MHGFLLLRVSLCLSNYLRIMFSLYLVLRYTNMIVITSHNSLESANMFSAYLFWSKEKIQSAESNSIT